jgi:hypothetical protein
MSVTAAGAQRHACRWGIGVSSARNSSARETLLRWSTPYSSFGVHFSAVQSVRRSRPVDAVREAAGILQADPDADCDAVAWVVLPSPLPNRRPLGRMDVSVGIAT